VPPIGANDFLKEASTIEEGQLEVGPERLEVS
jgi:hypothetical protein